MSSTNPKIKINDPVGDINSKFDLYIKLVVGVLLVAMITMLLMVGTLIVDSFHINSATYKEYADRVRASGKSEEINQRLTDQNNKNQQTIIDQQKQIIELMKLKKQ